MATSFRVDSRAAVLSVLNDQKTATPSQLRAVYRARPGSFSETPCAYIGSSDERITYTAQTRQREAVGLTAVVVDTLIDSNETEDRMDILVDLLVDRFWSAFASMPGGRGLLQLTSVSDTEIQHTGADGRVTVYRAAVLGFGDPANPTFVREGGP